MTFKRRPSPRLGLRRFASTFVVDLALGLFAGLMGVGVGLSAGCTPTDDPGSANPPPPTPGLRVTKYTDGDTIRLSDGSTVRLIGIDTPERGEDCWKQAGLHLRELVAERPVVLVSPPGELDHDRYGRLLRYVEVDGQDVGLEQIRDGYAVARYDGLEKGYQTHPRQNQYRQLDAASPRKTCCSEDAATPAKKCGR